MSVLYRLIGIKIDDRTKTDLIHDGFDQGYVSLKDAKDYFEKLGCTGSIDVLKFITDAETMKEEKKYSLNPSEPRLIYVLSLDEELKARIQKIFEEKGCIQEKRRGTGKARTVNQNLSKPIPLDEVKINDKIIHESNQETLKLFKEKDFIELLRIYKFNPQMFKTFSSYISSGDVVFSDERFSITEKANYDSLLIEIKNLGVDLDDSIIMSALNKFNGHLNLTLRFLLYQQAC